MQQEIDDAMKEIVGKYSALFEIIGQAKVEPVQISMEEEETNHDAL